MHEAKFDVIVYLANIGVSVLLGHHHIMIIKVDVQARMVVDLKDPGLQVSIDQEV